MNKLHQAPEQKRESLAAMHEAMMSVLLSSTDRVQAIVSRLQRLTSLDRAAVRPTDINDVLRDLTATIEAEASNKVPIRLTLHPVPVVTCETQTWITILTRLVSRAAAQPGSNLVDLISEFADGHIIVDIVEIGRNGDSPRSLDPGFAEAGGRIAATNWTLFQVRSWVQQQGGDLRQFGDEARGLTTRVLIPAS